MDVKNRVAIIGAGLIGEKRAAHLAGARLAAVYDPISARAEKLAGAYNAATEKNQDAR